MLHSLKRTHATIGLELTTVEDDGLTGRLLHTGEQATCHRATCASSESLDEVTRVAQTTVANDGHIVVASLTQGGIYLIDGRELRIAHAGYDTSGANRARAYADLHRVGTSLSESHGSLTSAYIAHHDVEVRVACARLLENLNDAT